MTETLARGFVAHGHEIVVLGYPGAMLEERMRGVVPFEPILKGMDLHPVTMLKAGAALRKHRSEIILAMMKKDARLTVPAARALGIPSVIRHANDRALGGGMYNRIFFGMMPAHHIVNSNATRATLLDSATWIDPEDITVIYNGIDSTQFENVAAANLGLPDDAMVFGFAGRLEIRKGLIDLMEAWPIVAQSLPNAWLVIVGKGADEQRALETLGTAPRVKWLGYRSDIPSIFKALDVLIVPSHWEGFGLTAAEGLAAGVPVVATKASSLQEIIQDGINGRLVPPRDPASLASALIEIARDPALRARMATAGPVRIMNDFGVEKMVDGYEKTLEMVRTRSGG